MKSLFITFFYILHQDCNLHVLYITILYIILWIRVVIKDMLKFWPVTSGILDNQIEIKQQNLPFKFSKQANKSKIDGISLQENYFF